MFVFTGKENELIRKKEDVQHFLDCIQSDEGKDFEVYFKNLNERNYFVLTREKGEWALLKRLDAYDANSSIVEIEGDIYDLLFSIRKSVNYAFYKTNQWDAYEM